MSATEPLCPRTGKLSYRGRTHAAKAARAVLARTRTGGGGLEPYLCRACGGWHLGRKR